VAPNLKASANLAAAAAAAALLLLQNDANLFAGEWRRFWKDFVSLPSYKASLDGRVFPELANEWGKWDCQWNQTLRSEPRSWHWPVASSAAAGASTPA
jgi:hypothetical protein